MKRKLDEELVDSAKKVKQSDNMTTKDNGNGNMASTTNSEGHDEKDTYVPPGIKLLFSNLSSDIQSSHDKLSKRLDNLEKDLEGKISELISVAIKTEVDKLRSEYSSEIDSLKVKVAQLEQSYADIVKNNGNASSAFEERKRRIVIRGLHCDRNETAQVTQDKVMALIRDGCKLSDVTVSQVERKFSRGKKPGPVIASVESFEKKQKLMKAKNALKNIDTYKRVYIENDYAPEIRNADTNLRTILKEIGKNKQYRVSGGKLFPVTADNGNNGRH